MQRNELKSMIMAALFAALDIVTTMMLFSGGWAFLPPGSFTVRVSLQFLWYGLAGWLLGPGWALGSAVTGDLIRGMMNPGGSGVFFPGYTLTAAVSGIMFGFLLYKRTPRLWRALLATGLYCLLISLPLSALWSQMTGGAAFWPALWTALPWRAALFAPYGFVLIGVQKTLEKPLGRYFS